MEAPNLAQVLEELAVGAERLRQVNSVNIASITIMAFDWLLTLNMEFALIWNTKWNWTKVLYIITRYMPFADTSLVMYHQFRTTLPQPSCKSIFDTTAFMFVAGMAIAELVFTLRTCAVWGKAKKLTWIVLSAYVATWSTIFIVLGFYIKNLTHEATPLGCILKPSNAILSVAFVVLMAYDAALLILMVIRAVAAFRSGGDSQLMRVVYSDGIIYYAYIFTLSLLNVLVITKLPTDYETLLLMLERVVHSALACRVVLHIRQQASPDTVTMISSRGAIPPNYSTHSVGGRWDNTVTSLTKEQGYVNPAVPWETSYL